MRNVFSILMIFLLLGAPYPNITAYAASQPATFDATELEAFFDGLMAAQMDLFHIPGGAVSIVQDGKLVFAKGYGYADVAQRKPVVADRTLFRLASLSKLFVWTAAMQLVEQGKLDLNADVNTYLKDFKIPSTYSKPITLLDLMDHTPGFEERALGTSARRPQEIRPLGEYLAGHIPARVFPPGEVTAYSNYGAALAGYIVSQVSGMPFDQYVQKNIFDPLQMQHSSFQQPLTDELAPDLAIGYVYGNGAYQPQGTEWAQLAPAAALSASATDMANFMSAHLQNGRFGNVRIMQESTMQTMHRQSFTNDPRVNGYAHGFLEATLDGQPLLGHTGDILYYHSGLFLLPEQNTGFFVAFNGSNGMAAVLNTLRTFMDHYYPASQPAPATPDGLNDSMQSYTGVYFPTRAEYTTAGKLLRMFQSVRVTPTGARRLIVSLGFPAQFTERYTEITQGVFRSTDLPPSVFGDVVFREDAQGRLTYLFQQNNPSLAYTKAPWYATPGFNLTLLGFVVLLFLSVIVWAPIGWWIRWRCPDSISNPSRLAAWWQGLLSLSALLFLIGFVVVFSNPPVYGLSSWARALFLLPLLIAILAVGMVFFMVQAWRRGWWSLLGRLHYTFVTFAGLAFTGWLAYWQLWIGYLR